MLNGLDLFSGIGGFALALKEWIMPIAYCECDRFCQSVLLSRIANGTIYQAPIWDDIRTFETGLFDEGCIDIITAGFPCQDISIAGLGKGLAGERSGLFWEIVRLSKEIKPAFIFLENVPAITSRGGLTVVRAIAEMGYDCRWCVISAASVGACHRRERWFYLARHSHSNNQNQIEKVENTIQEITDSLRVCDDGHTNCISSEQTDTRAKPEQTIVRSWRRSSGQYWPFESREHWQEIVSSMDKCSDGLSCHVDRLRALGNAVVPCQAKEAFKILMGLTTKI